jgi:hypothetical protein
VAFCHIWSSALESDGASFCARVKMPESAREAASKNDLKKSWFMGELQLYLTEGSFGFSSTVSVRMKFSTHLCAFFFPLKS